MVLDGKSSQEYSVNAGFLLCSILGPTLFPLYINDLPDDVICNIALCADDTTIYCKCDQASDLWQQLESASELESDLRDTVGSGRKWLVDFNAGKTQLVLFHLSINAGAIDVKIAVVITATRRRYLSFKIFKTISFVVYSFEFFLI